jgi:hypothetical protein
LEYLRLIPKHSGYFLLYLTASFLYFSERGEDGSSGITTQLDYGKPILQLCFSDVSSYHKINELFSDLWIIP